MSDHEKHMFEALALAARGRGWVSPNPMVGALVVKDGRVVGRGWHQKFGGPHAEIFALDEAGADARGATLYSTLEPCNHTGKTPPCVQAILKAGIAAVVFGASDRHAVASGGGAALRAAGVAVTGGVCEELCVRSNAAFFKFVRTGLPLVSLKWAMTLDGRIAAASGDSKWITGEAARAHAHELRAEHDAVLVGIGTVLADGPRLNCRPPARDGYKIRQPRRVILDSQARTPLDAPLWTAENGGPVTIVCKSSAPVERRAALQARGAEVLALPDQPEGGEIRFMLKALAERGVLSVMVEGGSRVLGSFVDARAADRAYVFIAPKILGGGLPAISGVGAARIAEALNLKSIRCREFDGDILVQGDIGE